MRQVKLVKRLYRACINHDLRQERVLFLKEFDKIFKRRESGRGFNARWTIVD